MESFTEVDKTSPQQRRLSDYFLDTFKNRIVVSHIHTLDIKQCSLLVKCDSIILFKLLALYFNNCSSLFLSFIYYRSYNLILILRLINRMHFSLATFSNNLFWQTGANLPLQYSWSLLFIPRQRVAVFHNTTVPNTGQL